MADDVLAQIEHDVKAYSDTFVKANHANDASLMRPWMKLPVLILSPDGPRALNTPEDVDAMYGAGVEALKGTGYHNSLLYNFQITMLNKNTALVKCDCDRTKEDGSILQQFPACYVVAKGPEHWQIVSLVAQDR